ncbi:MAG TPA: hypothetical protein VMK13_16885 [Streptosporangiaceae bacterium]|nr:hypothetical protein [Streptosporangiaceae bacterium]
MSRHDLEAGYLLAAAARRGASRSGACNILPAPPEARLLSCLVRVLEEVAS